MKRIFVFSLLTVLAGSVLLVNSAECRMYDPKTGRFLQRDPIGYIDGPNPYTYVRNNPVNWIDPYGLATAAKRPLSNVPWIPILSSNPIDNIMNTELSHEHIFFNSPQTIIVNGKQQVVANIGFGPSGLFTETDPQVILSYRDYSKDYDDKIIADIINQMVLQDYQLLYFDSFNFDPSSKNNCQNFVSSVFSIYDEITRQ